MTLEDAQQFAEEVRAHLDAGAKTLCVTRAQAEFLMELAEGATRIHRARQRAQELLEKYGEH